MKTLFFVNMVFLFYLIGFVNLSNTRLKTSKTGKSKTIKKVNTVSKVKKVPTLHVGYKVNEMNYDTASFPDNDCSIDNCQNGKCSEDKSICRCHKDFANYPESGNHGVYCSYRRKNQLVPFLIEMFVSFGIGHLVIGRIATGIIKMVLGCSGCFAGICLFCVSAGKECAGSVGLILFGILGVAYILWYFIDLFLFGFNVYTDGNGVDLRRW